MVKLDVQSKQISHSGVVNSGQDDPVQSRMSRMNINKHIISILVIILLNPLNVQAYEVLDVCATYDNTNKSYKVTGNVYKGSELNDRTNSYNYDSFSKYVVIFWSNDQASVIEMDSSLGDLTFEQSGKDQDGRPWTIKKGHSFCY